MATKKKDPRAATCRPKGIIGSDPLVYRAFRAHFSIKDINVGHNNRGMWVLDFGAGEGAVNTSRSGNLGMNLSGHMICQKTHHIQHLLTVFGAWMLRLPCGMWCCSVMC